VDNYNVPSGTFFCQKRWIRVQWEVRKSARPNGQAVFLVIKEPVLACLVRRSKFEFRGGFYDKKDQKVGRMAEIANTGTWELCPMDCG
jgi:hypothetical protein